MRGTIIKQPNGKYCIMDSYEVKQYNLDEKDIINIYIEEAKANIASSKYCGAIIERTVDDWPRDVTHDISDNLLKMMGFNKPYKELVKFVARKPIDQFYIANEFATFGKCPNCHATVIDGIMGKDERCKCGQILKW